MLELSDGEHRVIFDLNLDHYCSHIPPCDRRTVCSLGNTVWSHMASDTP